MKHRRSRRVVAGLSAVMAGALLFSASAQAASLTNRDSENRKLTVVGDKGRSSTVLDAGASVTGFCIGGCTVKIDGFDDVWSLEGNELVSIEGGKLYYDGEDKSSAAKPDPDAN